MLWIVVLMTFWRRLSNFSSSIVIEEKVSRPAFLFRHFLALPISGMGGVKLNRFSIGVVGGSLSLSYSLSPLSS